MNPTSTRIVAIEFSFDEPSRRRIATFRGPITDRELLDAHPDFPRADGAVTRIARGEDSGFASAHTLAETFAVLSRIPSTPRLQPADVLQLMETEFIPRFVFLALHIEDYQLVGSSRQ